jgi:2Fe-2S ferredoxin
MSEATILTEIEKEKEQQSRSAQVTFLPGNLTFPIQIGQSILEVAIKNDIPLDHACGGVCACSTCHVIVKKGMEHLSEMEDDEADQVEEAPGLTLTSRLGCQARLVEAGDVAVEIPEWNRNYVREGE